jgi:hypothetical protein
MEHANGTQKEDAEGLKGPMFRFLFAHKSATLNL